MFIHTHTLSVLALCGTWCPASVWHEHLMLFIFCWHSTTLISPHPKGRKMFAWCCLIYQNSSFILITTTTTTMLFLHFVLEQWTFFSNPVFIYKEFRFCSAFSSVVSYSVSPLRLTSLAACCRRVRLHCGFSADSWNPWEVAAHWGCHVVIRAAVACRLSLLDEVPVCVAAMCPGHMDIPCYLVSVSVCELTPPEGFGHTVTCQIWMNLSMPLGNESYWGKKKIINIFLTFWNL